MSQAFEFVMRAYADLLVLSAVRTVTEQRARVFSNAVCMCVCTPATAGLRSTHAQSAPAE